MHGNMNIKLVVILPQGSMSQKLKAVTGHNPKPDH